MGLLEGERRELSWPQFRTQIIGPTKLKGVIRVNQAIRKEGPLGLKRIGFPKAPFGGWLG